MDLSLAAATAGKSEGRMDARLTLAERALTVAPDRVEFRRFLKPESVTSRGEAGEGLAAVYRALGPTVLPTVVDRRGKTLSIGRGPEATASGTIDVIFPETPVAVGDAWTSEYGALANITVRCRLEAVGPVADRRVALVSVANSEPPSGTKSDSPYALAPGTLFAFDLNDGRWLRVGAAFTLNLGDARTLRVGYAIARDGAPDWPTILGAFPEAKLPAPPKTTEAK